MGIPGANGVERRKERLTFSPNRIGGARLRPPSPSGSYEPLDIGAASFHSIPAGMPEREVDALNPAAMERREWSAGKPVLARNGVRAGREQLASVHLDSSGLRGLDKSLSGGSVAPEKGYRFRDSEPI